MAIKLLKSPGHWFDWAVMEWQRAVKEDPRADMDDPRIRQYGIISGIAPGGWDDDQPWCAVFANAALESSQVSRPGTKSPMAKSFLRWGIELTSPMYGCIVVLNSARGKAFGHVGFYVGEKDGYIYLLGGNQDNAVSVGKFKKGMVAGYRWPKNAAMGSTGPIAYAGPKQVRESSDT